MILSPLRPSILNDINPLSLLYDIPPSIYDLHPPLRDVCLPLTGLLSPYYMIYVPLPSYDVHPHLKKNYVFSQLHDVHPS